MASVVSCRVVSCPVTPQQRKTLLDALLTLYEFFVRFGENVLQETPIKTDGATVGFVKTGAITDHRETNS